MGNIMDFLIYKPFAWLLIQLYTFTNSYVFAIILFALLTKVLLLFFTAKGKLGMMRTQRIQPKLQALQKAYPNDKEKLNNETMKLYQAEGVSPTGGCLWTLLPFPVLIALYSVIREPLTHLMNFTGESPAIIEFLTNLFTENNIAFTAVKTTDAYAQMSLAQTVHENFALVQGATEQVIRDIDFSFFGTNMSQIPAFPWVSFGWLFFVPLVSAATSYLAYYMSTKMSKMPQTSQTKSMALISPLISLWLGFTMPAIMSVYWIANNLFSMVQDYFLTKHYTKVLDKEQAHKDDLAARRKAAEEKQKEEDKILRAERMAQKKNHKGKYKIKSKPGK